MPNEITARDLWLINAYERRDLTSDDAYVFTIKLCDNDVDRDGERFTVESLNMLEELFVGGMGIVDHNPKNKNITARILKCDVKQVPTRTTATGERVGTCLTSHLSRYRPVLLLQENVTIT